MKSILFLSLLFFASQNLLSQTPVFLENPGFEDLAQYASVPGGWRSCAFNGESPPDIHPVKNGRFGVDQKPAGGSTYLGLVVRENGTAESIGQKLSAPLAGGQCYEMSIQLCRSDTLISLGRVSREMVNFDRPVVLRIWGGVSPCGQKELLAVSEKVDNFEWEKFTFRFQPTEDLTWVVLEAYFAKPKEKYNGNLLMDEASPFVPINCESGKILADPAAFDHPRFSYRKIIVSVPHTDGYFSSQGNGKYLVNLRLAQSEDVLPALLRQNCERTGFLPHSAELAETLGTGLKELGANAEKFKRKLIVGIYSENGRLAKKRKRKVEKLFAEINLPKAHFEIKTLAAKPTSGWPCGGEGIWLKFSGK